MLKFLIPVDTDTKKVIFFKMLKSLSVLFVLLCAYFLFTIKSEEATLDKLYWQYYRHQIAYKIDDNYPPIVLMYYFHENEIITEHRNIGEVIYTNFSEGYNPNYHSINPKSCYNLLIGFYKKINTNNLELNENFFDAKNLVSRLNMDSENKYYKFIYDPDYKHFVKEYFEKGLFKISIDKYTNSSFKSLDRDSLLKDFSIYFLLLIVLPIIYFIIKMFYTINVNKK